MICDNVVKYLYQIDTKYQVQRRAENIKPNNNENLLITRRQSKCIVYANAKCHRSDAVQSLNNQIHVFESSESLPYIN